MFYREVKHVLKMNYRETRHVSEVQLLGITGENADLTFVNNLINSTTVLL